MKQIYLSVLLAGMLCGVSCAPKEDVKTPASRQSNSDVQTETAIVEVPPIATEPAQMPAALPQASKNPVVKMVTNKGTITMELYADKAPITVGNFLNYVNSKLYNGTLFHRVIPNFMIQGGGFTPEMQQKPTQPPIKNESYNQVRNERGTIAMARTNAPDSATSQFFINHIDNRSLDFDGPMAPGYAVFGKVVDGLNVVDAIAGVQTRQLGPHANVPVETILIESIDVIKE